MAKKSSAAAPSKNKSEHSVVDLRARIVEISEQLLETEGVSALSMREVARRAGVTHQAPYHHFGDREGILAQLIEKGFDDLATRLNGANAEATRILEAGGTLDRSSRYALALASGKAYVGYAIEHPSLFRIMFRSDLCNLSRYEHSLAAGDKAYNELKHMVSVLHDGLASEVQCSVYWAQVHGLACLLLDGPWAAQIHDASQQHALADASLDVFARAMVGYPWLPGQA